MYINPGFTLAEHLFGRVDTFLKTMGAEAYRRRLGVFSIAIWQRLRGLVRRFSALHAMWKAGTLPKPSSAVSASSKGEDLNRGGRKERRDARKVTFDPLAPGLEVLDAARTRPGSLLPRGFGWLHTMLPENAPSLTGTVGMILDGHPEMRQFVAECPQVGRVLRPLCTMLGVKPPAFLALPKRVRRNAGGGYPSPNPSRKGSGIRRSPREIAAAAIEKALRTGKPVDPTKMSSVAFGYVLHWPRDEHCPPPEIGYGGKAFPNTPKDYVPPRD